MSDDVSVSPSIMTPTHDISLSDGTTTLGFLTADSSGRASKNLFAIGSAERTPLQTTQGAPGLTDTLYPWMTLYQDDFSGGIRPGLFEKDSSKFADGIGVQIVGSSIRPAHALTMRAISSSNRYHKTGGVFPAASLDGVTYTDYSWKSMKPTTGLVATALTDKIVGTEYVYTAGIRYVNFVLRKVGNPIISSIRVVTYNWDGVNNKPGTLYDYSDYTYALIDSGLNESRAFILDSPVKIPTADCAIGLEITYNSSSTDYYEILTLDRYMQTDGYWFNSGTGFTKDTTYSLYHYIYYYWTYFRGWKRARGVANEHNNILLLNHSLEDFDSVFLDYTYNTLIYSDGTDISRDRLIDIGTGAIYLNRKYPGYYIYLSNVNNVDTLNTQPLDVNATAGVYYNDPAYGKSVWLAYQPDRNYLGNRIWLWQEPLPNSHPTYIGGTFLYPDCPDDWDEQVIANVTRDTSAGEMKFTIADAFTTGIIGSYVIIERPVGSGHYADISHSNQIHFIAKSSVALAAGDMQLLIDDTENCASPILSLNLPAMKANEPTMITLDYDPVGKTGLNAVISIGLKLVNDKGAMTFSICSEILATRDSTPVILNDDGELKGMVTYGDPETVWVFTSKNIYYLTGTMFMPIPIKEYASSAVGDDIGTIHVVGDLYLYFNIGNKLFRYYRNTIDYIGPNLGIGRGKIYDKIIDAVSFPGNVLFVLAYTHRSGIYNGVYGYKDRFYVLKYDGNTWQELYEIPKFSTQSNANYDARLYISDCNTSNYAANTGSDYPNVYVFIGGRLFSFNSPLSEDIKKFDNHWYGSFVTNQHTTRLYTIDKYFKTLEVNFVNDKDNLANKLTTYYRTDIDNADLIANENITNKWSLIGDLLSGEETEILPDSIHPNGGIGKNIALQFEWFPASTKSVTPTLENYKLEAYGVIEPKRIISFYTILGDADNEVDRQGGIVSATITDKLSTLMTWYSNPKPLTLHTNISSLDNIKVQLLSFEYFPIEVAEGELPGHGHEKILARLSLVEL